MNADFLRLGKAIESRWERHRFDPASFAPIAVSSLERANVFGRFEVEEIAERVMLAADLPPQKMRRFGQPPVTVYAGRDFYIELLFWVDSPVDIHQHAFSGAFGVLHGSSYHATYAFHEGRQQAPALRTGILDFTGAEVLQCGDVRPIAAGEQFIHALLHLDAPSVSIVVRTNQEPEFLPQYRYYTPGLAVDPFFEPEPLRTRLQMLTTLFDYRPAAFLRLAKTFAARGDLWDSFATLDLAARRGLDSPAFYELLAAFAQEAPHLAGIAHASFRERRRARIATGLMRRTRDPELRLLLALLINTPERHTLERIVREHCGSNRAELLETFRKDWNELSAFEILGPVFADHDEQRAQQREQQRVVEHA